MAPRMRTLLLVLTVLGVALAVPSLADAAPCNGEPLVEAYWCWWGPGAQQVHVCGKYVGDVCLDVW